MAKRRLQQRGPGAERPDIFRYHDYRAFLSDWLGYLKATVEDFSLRNLAERGQVTAAYLSMVLSGARPLSLKALHKLAPHFRLSPTELSFLENLVKIGTIDSSGVRFSAMDRMSRFTTYQEHNPAEARFVEFMGKWYHLAIREMARLPGFKADPGWIRGKLRHQVTLKQARDALKFLTESGYIKVGADGSVTSSSETLKCQGDVYTTVLIECYRQMFALAAESMERTPPQERNLEGFTVTMNAKRFEKARAILTRALDEIEGLEKSQDGENDSVYQVEVVLFPLTQRGGS